MTIVFYMILQEKTTGMHSCKEALRYLRGAKLSPSPHELVSLRLEYFANY